jgi:hypothetical protein
LKIEKKEKFIANHILISSLRNASRPVKVIGVSDPDPR